MTLKINKNKRRNIPPLAAAIALAVLCQNASLAEFTADLNDPYLEREFDWAMFIDAHGMNYLHYPGSQLHPLTDVRINFRPLQRGRNQKKPALLYEELWYHDAMPVGLRRYALLKVAPNRFGAIVIGANNNDPKQVSAIANALVRITLDLQLKNIVTSVVIIPDDTFEQLTGALGSYGFFPYMKVMAGRQISMHLRAYPPSRDKDNYYYFQKGY